MKNVLKLMALVFVMAISLTACVNGKGDVVIQTFEISGFTKIDHGIKGDIVLVNDVNQFVEVHAQQNIIDILKIEKNGSTLEFRTKAAKSIGNYEELTYYVHCPVVEYIKIGGKGSVKGNDITSDNFSCKLTADGKLELTEVNSSYVEIIATGAGNVIMKGNSDKTDIGVGSSAFIQCFELSSDNCDVQLKGNGSIQVKANNTLKVLISGSGTVYYKGTPSIDPTVTGSGIIVNAN